MHRSFLGSLISQARPVLASRAVDTSPASRREAERLLADSYRSPVVLEAAFSRRHTDMAAKKAPVGLSKAKLNPKACIPKKKSGPAATPSPMGMTSKLKLSEGLSEMPDRSQPIDEFGYELIQKAPDAGSESSDSLVEKSPHERGKTPESRKKSKEAPERQPPPVRRTRSTVVRSKKRRELASRRRKVILIVVTVSAFIIGGFFGMGVHFYVCCSP